MFSDIRLNESGLEPQSMARIESEFIIANNRDVLHAGPQDRIPDSVKHLAMSGVVDTGAARLVLPERAMTELNLDRADDVTVRYADHRREQRPRVTNVWLKLCGREGVFSATIEPSRQDALIGAIVLEELDLIADCATQSLHPRDPDHIVTEIE
jgi:predicted aspartyl protease